MATLVSPGVSVTVTDESFYGPAGTGTVPLIVIATQQDKTAPDGSGTASYTTSANAETLQLITSQRELLQNYGNPSFQSSGGTQLHGNELNEIGLLTAYSFMGIANRAYVLRADIDLAALESSATATTSPPADGSYWLDIDGFDIGLKRWSGTAWELQTVARLETQDINGTAPKSGYGVVGDYAAVFFNAAGVTQSSWNIYEKVASAQWEIVGSSAWATATSGDYQSGSHADLPTTRSTLAALVAGDLFFQQNQLNNGSRFVFNLYDSSASQFTEVNSVVRANTELAYALLPTPDEGQLFTQFDDDGDGTGQGTFTPYRHNGNATLLVQSSTALTDTEISNVGHTGGNVAFSITINKQTTAVDVVFTTDTDADGNLSVDDMVADINSAISAANATLTQANTVVASNVAGKVRLVNSVGTDLDFAAGNVPNFSHANLNLSATNSNYAALSFTAQSDALTGTTADGVLWYDAELTLAKTDILYQNAGTWTSYNGDVQLAASEPTTQADGTTALADGDLWVDTSDLENYPQINKYNGTSNAFVLVDSTDNVSPDGILFDDIRATKGGAISGDAPGTSTYPSGMLAWNKRASSGNVKRWNATQLTWDDYSGNKSDGSPYMLRKAQRAVVVREMQSVVTSNQEIRNEVNRFNLIACPGYPELADEMNTLSTDRKNTAFTIIDPPLRLSSDATSTANWINNTANAGENGEDGLLAASEYSAVYYPHALATNLDGTNVMVPSSYMALRTIAFNDQVAFPWFAPAGFQRGVVNNATSVGYLDATSAEFIPVSLNEGQRDALYSNKMNAITSFPNRGIVVFGQKTLSASGSSALDRVNVARLIVYIREQLDDIVKPFLFEPNDELTRSNAKVVVDRFLGELVSQRGLFDFVTVCDTTNNTPARIDRNELHIDIAIQPVKAVEFIYIPIRIQNTLGQTN